MRRVDSGAIRLHNDGMAEDRPRGMKFTDLYRERGPEVQDSVKLRRRLAMRMSEDATRNDLIQPIRAETGWTMAGHSRLEFWLSLTEDLALDDLLDFVTIFSRIISEQTSYNEGPNFIGFVQRAFNEENVAFEVDDYGGVHYRVDTAFQHNRAAALQALSGTENVSARTSYDIAQQALASHPTDTLLAVRSAFDAVENLFKRRFTTSRLGATEVKKELRDSGDAHGSRARDSARRLNESFAEWVNACHLYRHADGEPEPSPPPRWLAIALVDSASIYIRYLTAS